MMLKNSNSVNWALALALVLGLGLGLRIWGVNFGLPGVYHPDEERIVHNALAFGLGDLNPHYFNYPSFTMYFLFFQYGVFYGLGRLLGMFSGVGDFQSLFFTDPSVFYLIGRVSSALWGTATLLVMYFFGKKAYGKLSGLVAAAVLAVTFIHAESSHYISTDIPLAFFITASFCFILDILNTGRRRAYVLAGILAGLGAASKYNAATLALPILLAHLWGPNGSGGLRRIFLHPWLWLSAAGMLAAFFAGSPYCFLDFPQFWRDFAFISAHMRSGVYGTGESGRWGSYFLLLFRDQVPFTRFPYTPLGFLYLGGVAWALWRRGKKQWLLLVYPVLYFLLIGSWAKCNPRYLIPVYPALAVLGGGMLQAFWEKISPRRRLWFSALLTLLFILPIRNIVIWDIVFSRPDTKTLARTWIEANIPAGTRIALEWDNNATVQLQEDDRAVREKIRGYEEGLLSTIHHPASQMAEIHRRRLAAERGRTYEVVRIGEVRGLTLVPRLYSLEELEQAGVEYLAVSSEIYNWFKGVKNREAYPVHAAFYDAVFELDPVKVFDLEGQPGPVIRVYRLKAED